MRIYWQILFLLFLLGSCKRPADGEKNAVKDFVGRHVLIPDGLTIQIQDIVIDSPLKNADYKIIMYLDSMGCTSCRMKLNRWKTVMDEFQSIDNENVAFLMILNASATKDMIYLLKRDDFLLPVSFDSENAYYELNQLPKEDDLCTVMLDDANRIVAIGNPASNPKIRDFYRWVILGGSQDVSVEMEHRNCLSENMGVVHSGDTIVKRFSVFNRSDTLLTIRDLIPSCDCTTAVVSTGQLPPHSEASVSVTLVADSVAGPFRRTVDLFYNEINKSDRFILYGYISN